MHSTLGSHVRSLVLDSSYQQDVYDGSFRSRLRNTYYYNMRVSVAKSIFSSLALLTRLNHVSVKCCFRVDLDSLIITLSKLKELRFLELDHRRLTCEHLERLLPELPLLSTLDLRFCSSITSHRLLSSSRYLPSTLTSLVLHEKIPDDFFQHIQHLKALTSLTV